MSNSAQGFWYDIIRRLGSEPALPPVDVDEAWAEYLESPDDSPARPAHSAPRTTEKDSWLSPDRSVSALHASLIEIYGELRRHAEHFMRGQPPDHTLQATALVNETFLKLSNKDLVRTDRAHLLALAATAMRQVLVDHARARRCAKRSPPGERISSDEIQSAFEERAVDVLALDAALSKLAGIDPTMARAVDLHFFAGLTMEATADAVGMPLRTLERRWYATRAWLRNAVEGGAGEA